MGRIPESLVQEILDKTDIVSVVGERVRLTKRGGRWLGLCPFHNEKTPSFHVDQDKGLFYCFGCQKGGSVVQFLMELEKMSFPEVMEELASKAGVPLQIEEAPSEEEKDRKALLELYERLAGTFHWFLTRHSSGGPALGILRRRGLSENVIRDFRLGYAPASRRWMHDFLRGKGYSAEFLARSGLFAASSPTYPIFAHRIMFPIVDAKERTIAFGGRLMEGEGPKYINSPDTILFRKQENLFALNKALPAIKKTGQALICEGYMDALSFHAAGQTGAVAPLGTAFTSAQARLLKRQAERLLLCFDTDEAGKKAAERASAIAAAEGLVSMVLNLPGAKDPSEILEKEGPGTLQKVVNFTITSDDFLISRAKELFDVGTVEGKGRAAAYLYPYADALGSEVRRSAFLDLVSREFGANPLSLRTDYETARRVGKFQGRTAYDRASRDLPGRSAASRITSLARTQDLVLMAALTLDSPRFGACRSRFAAEDLDDFRARDLYLALEDSYRAEDLGMDAVLGRVETQEARRFVLEASASGELGLNADKLIEDGINAVRRRSMERKRDRIVANIAALRSVGGVSAGNDDLRNELLREKMNLDAELAAVKG